MKTLAAGLGLGLCLGCRSSGPVEAPVEDPPVAATSDAAPSSPAPAPEPEPASAPAPAPQGTPGLALEPPPPQPVVPVSTPFSPRAAVVMPITVNIPVVLFEDERPPIRRKVAEFLAARGHRLVPFGKLEQIEAAATEGRLVLEDDRRCRAPLTHRELYQRYFAGAPEIGIDTMCLDAGCRLQVHGRQTEDQWFAYQSGIVHRPHEPRSWVEARLRRTEGMVGGIVGGVVGGLSHPPPVEFGVVHSIGPWDDVPDGQRLRTAKVSSCAHPDPQPEIEYDVRLAVGADGRIGRCEAISSHPRARPTDAECMCQAFEDVRYPAGKAGRRLRVDLTDNGQGHFSGFALTEVQPGTGPWVSRLVESSALETCVVEANPGAGFTATVVLGLHPDGEVHQIRVFGAIDAPEEIRFSQCMIRRLEGIPLPCAPPGVDTLQVRVAPS